MKKIIIIQARMNARRFPGKVLKNLLDKPVLQWVVDAASKVSLIDDVVVATSDQNVDQAIVSWCSAQNIKVFQGNESDVLTRYYEAAKHMKADLIVRITADCPLLDPNIVEQIVYLVSEGYADYASNVLPATWPDGLDCEAFTFKALETAFLEAKRLSDREHVTSFIRNNQHRFKTLNIVSPIPGIQKHRWTVDTPEDLEYLNKILKKFETTPSTYALLAAINKSHELTQPAYQRNEGFDYSIQNEEITCTQFAQSHQLLERALQVIPTGSQTFSKSYIQYPQNTSPLFLTHGTGGRVWDVDGNEYVDLVSALLPNILGYADPDINYAIQNQLQKGVVLSLATELEIELAEMLCTIIPSAEKTRFAKNGTDVTSAAIRLARAYTDREKIIVCGYHGWQDWYIGSTSRNKGIPKAVCDLTFSVPYNDLEQVETLLKTEKIAGIIMEPCNVQPPLPGYLQGIKDCCERYGTLMIFDEIITGFRFALGGAQEYFGVTPHLSCFGKAMGNGMPISAIVGRSDIMNEMNEIFFSGTFGGEALSLAAAIATIQKIKSHNVINNIWQKGEYLATKVKEIAVQNQISEYIDLGGFAPWKIIKFSAHQHADVQTLKTLFLQEMIKKGILILGSHNINYAHSETDLHQTINAYKAVMHDLSNILNNNLVTKKLQNPSIKNLFKVR